jgi:hypothetical protein
MIVPVILVINSCLFVQRDEKEIFSNYVTLQRRDKRLSAELSFFSGKNDSVSSLKSVFFAKNKIRISTTLLNHLLPKPMPIASDDLYFFRIYASKISQEEIMDGLGALNGFRWSRLKKNQNEIDYKLQRSAAIYDVTHGSSDGIEEGFWNTALPFIDYINHLPDTEKQDRLAGKAFKFPQLPPSAQVTIQKLLQQVYNSDIEAKNNPIDMSQVTRAMLSIDNKTPEGAKYSEFFLTMKTTYGSFGVRISDFPTRLREAKQKGQSVLPIHEQDRDDAEYSVDYFNEEKYIRRNEALKAEALNQIVDVNLKGVDMFTILKTISKKYDVDFITSERPFDIGKIDAKFSKTELWKVLDTVCRESGGWSWELRESGVLLLRSPQNTRHRELPNNSTAQVGLPESANPR